MLSSLLKKQKGMTLLEVIIVLGIMGVIAAGVVVLAQRAIDNQNITKLNQALNTIQTAMIATYRSKKSYPEVLTDPVKSEQLANGLIAMGKITKEDLINPFTGEALNIFTAKNNIMKNKAFAIKVGNLTQSQCTSIVSSGSDLFGFIQVEYAGGALVDDFYVEPNATAPLGVIKSTKGGPNTFDLTNLEQIVNLCGGSAGAASYYDIFLGGR